MSGAGIMGMNLDPSTLQSEHLGVLKNHGKLTIIQACNFEVAHTSKFTASNQCPCEISRWIVSMINEKNSQKSIAWKDEFTANSKVSDDLLFELISPK